MYTCSGFALARGTLLLGAMLLVVSPRAPTSAIRHADSVVSTAVTQTADSSSLFAQSASALLERQFPSSAISYLLLDASNGSTLAVRWPDEGAAIPAGSLMKPFVAIAYGAAHDDVFPYATCHGTKDSCWLPAGHGRLSLTRAIAESCNAYFLLLAARMSAADLAPVCRRYGLQAPDASASPRGLVGLNSAWHVRPASLAHAYLVLAQQPRTETAALVLSGMEQSASSGTAKAIGAALHGEPVLAKTGTAPCTHHPRSAADGFVVALVPADTPRILLLVRVHGVTGASAASTAGQMLAALEKRR